MSKDAYLGNTNLKKVNTPVEYTKEKMIATGWFNYINVDYDK